MYTVTLKISTVDACGEFKKETFSKKDLTAAAVEIPLKQQPQFSFLLLQSVGFSFAGFSLVSLLPFAVAVTTAQQHSRAEKTQIIYSSYRGSRVTEFGKYLFQFTS